VLVKEEALGTDLGGKYLLVIGEGNVVERRSVELGPLIDSDPNMGQMRVIRPREDGAPTISPEERYIVNGMQRARPGLPVDPQMAEQSQSPAEPAGPPAEGHPASPDAPSD
jgi:multidrug efflux system membrane fusion protein